MPCHSHRFGDGSAAIICTPRRRAPKCKCGNRATLLCDWRVPVTTKKPSGTCDAPLCRNCTTSPAPDKDLCPTHVEAYLKWKAARSE